MVLEEWSFEEAEPHGTKWIRSRILGRYEAINGILTLDKIGKGSKKIFSVKNVVLTLGGTSLGDGKATFDPEARAWLFFQLHRQNGFKIGGLEERPAQETLGD